MIKPLLLSTLALGLCAQDPGADDLARLLDTSQLGSASKRAQGVAEAPADVTVLSARDLQALGYRTLAEALGGVAGFRTNHDRAYQNLGVRGLYLLGDQNTRILVMLDGHTLNSPADTGSSKFGEDLGIPMDRVDRIEIIRGPASSMYGNNALFGVVNVVTRSAASPRRERQAGLALGSGGLQELWGHGGFRIGEARASVTATRLQRSGDALDLPDLSPTPLAAELDRETRTSGHVRVQGERWSFAGFAMERTQRLALAPWQSQVGSPDNAYRNQILFGDLRWEPVFGPLEGLVRLYGDRTAFHSTFRFDGTREVAPGLFHESDPDRGLGVELQARMPLGTQWMATLGTEQRWHRFQGSTTSGHRVETEVGHGSGNTYLQLEWSPAASLRMVGGLQLNERRIGHLAYQRDGVAVAAPHAEGTRNVAPRLAVIWQPTPADSLKLLSSTGFRAGTVFEQFYTDGESSQSNPRLEPEHLSTVELLWRRQWGGGLTTQASHSRFTWDHLIHMTLDGSWEHDAHEGTHEGEGIQVYRNTEDQVRGQATEVELQWAAGPWSLEAQAGFYQWRNAQGENLPNVARTQGGLKVIYRGEGWSAAAEVRQVGARRSGEGIEAPGALTCRASLRKEWGRGWLQLTGEDLGQARRRELIAVEYEPVHLLAGRGRSLNLGAGLRF